MESFNFAETKLKEESKLEIEGVTPRTEDAVTGTSVGTTNNSDTKSVVHYINSHKTG